MDLTQSLTVVGIVVSAAAVVVATLAWRTSVGNRDDLAAVEKRQRHRELRPDFEVTARLTVGDEIGLIIVKLVGPRNLDRLDWIKVTVRDDKPGRGDTVLPGGPTPEEIREQVWGPFRLRPSVDGADQEGRTARQPGPILADSCLFTIERTTPPYWYSSGTEGWRRDYATGEVRLSVESGRGADSWSEKVEFEASPLGDGPVRYAGAAAGRDEAGVTGDQPSGSPLPPRQDHRSAPCDDSTGS